MTAHCPECAELIEWFGIGAQEGRELGQWHAGHPGWHVSADEEAAMAAHTGGEWWA